jgi:hypothetical protein
MRKYLLAVACVASLGLASQAQATTILGFGQTNPSDAITATVSAGVTSITTNSVSNPGSIPIQITNLGGVPVSPAQGAFETFANVHSVGSATMVGGQIVQTFTGTIQITSLANGGGTNILTTVFTGVLSGNSIQANTTVDAQTIAYTTALPQLLPFITGTISRDFSIGLSNISPPL